MRRFLPLLYAGYIGLLAYSCLFFMWGTHGVREFHKLEQFRNEIDENISHLESINTGLMKEFHRLKTSPEVIQLKARELGYYTENEKHIKITGMTERDSFYSIGKLMKFTFPTTDRKALFRAISVCCGLVAFLMFTVFSKKRDSEV